MKASHEAFRAVYAEREKARAGKNIPTDKATAKAKLLKEALENLFTLLDAHHLSGPVEGIERNHRNYQFKHQTHSGLRKTERG